MDFWTETNFPQLTPKKSEAITQKADEEFS